MLLLSPNERVKADVLDPVMYVVCIFSESIYVPSPENPHEYKRLKAKAPSVALNGKPITATERHLPYGITQVLPATRHKWTYAALTPANQAGTRFTYPGRMEGWVDLGSPIAARSEVEPTTAWSQVRRPNRYATESPAWSLYCQKLRVPRLHFATDGETCLEPVQLGVVCW